MTNCDVDSQQCSSPLCMEYTSRLTVCLKRERVSSLKGLSAWAHLGSSEQGRIVQKSIESVERDCRQKYLLDTDDNL